MSVAALSVASHLALSPAKYDERFLFARGPDRSKYH
jgi:hypothetical protein